MDLTRLRKQPVGLNRGFYQVWRLYVGAVFGRMVRRVFARGRGRWGRLVEAALLVKGVKGGERESARASCGGIAHTLTLEGISATPTGRCEAFKARVRGCRGQGEVRVR